MKTATLVDELTIGDGRQAERVRHQLEEVRSRLAAIATEREAASGGIGRALAAMRLGNRSANTKAGELSLKRSGLDSEARDLQAVETALVTALEAWERDEQERTRSRLVAHLDQLDRQRRDVEARYAAMITEAIEATAALHAHRDAWSQAVTEARRLGVTVPKHHRGPHEPAVVRLNTGIITLWEDPKAVADRWLKNGWR